MPWQAVGLPPFQVDQFIERGPPVGHEIEGAMKDCLEPIGSIDEVLRPRPVDFPLPVKNAEGDAVCAHFEKPAGIAEHHLEFMIVVTEPAGPRSYHDDDWNRANGQRRFDQGGGRR
jgi:hypothetical protein